MENQELLSFQEKIRNDPLWFASEILGEHPWEREAEILLSVRDNKYTAVRSGHGVGKTYSAARAALWFFCSFYNSIVLTTAPTWRQVRKLLWGEIHKAHRNSHAEIGGELLDTELRANHNWYIQGLSTDDPDRFQGYHAQDLLVIIDEASGVSREIYEACISVMTSANCKMLAIGNPIEPSGWFFEAFQSDAWNHIHISSYDSPNCKGGMPYPKLVTPEWIEERRKDWGAESPMFQSRVLGEFPQSGADTLVPLSWLDAEDDGNQYEDEPIILGVDVARYGTDETVLLLRRGGRIIDVVTSRQSSTMATVGRVLQLQKQYNIEGHNIRIDDCGVGGGVTDRLKEQGFAVRGVNVGSRPFGGGKQESRYFNLRAQIFWAIRTALNPAAKESALYIPERFKKLKAQLSALKYSMHSDAGKIAIEKKDDYKKRIGCSPDWADALSLTYAGATGAPEIIVL